VWAVFRYPLGNDPAIFQFYAWAMTVGDMPYRECFDVNTPGVMILHWAWGVLTAFEDAAFHSLTVTLSTLSLVGGAWWLRDRVPREALLLGLAVAIWAFVGITPWDRGQRELFQGFFLLGAFALIGRHPLVAGGLAGCATTIKIAVLPVVWLCWMAWMIPTFKERGTREGLKASLWSFAGFLVPLGAVVGWLYAYEALAPFLQIQTTYLPLHRTVLTVPVTEALAKTLPLFLVGLGIAALVHRTWALAALHLGAVAIFVGQRHGWTYHMHMAIPFVLPTVALLAARIPKRAFLPLIAVPLVLATLTTVYDHGRGMTRAERVDDHWDYPAHEKVAEYLREHSLPTDRVLTNNDEQQLLYMARRRSATPFVYGFLFSESNPEPVLRNLGFARYTMVVARRPGWVVWNMHPYSPELDSLEANPSLFAWVRSNCRLDAEIEPYAVYRCFRPLDFNGGGISTPALL